MAEPNQTEPSKSPDRKNRFILLLDSDAHNLSRLSTLLSRLDYRVFTAMSAREAIDVMLTSVPSLIITSLNLKDMDSLKFLQKIKKSRELGDIPFIALTEQGNRNEEKRSFAAGAVDCLEQPVSAERLYRAVQKVVETTPRTCIRIPMLLPVKITGAQHGDSTRTCMLDLSERGMYLVYDEPAVVKTRLSLLINLNGRLIPVEAVVLHSYRNGEGPYLQAGMAVEFARIDPKDQEAIRKFISDDIMRGIDQE
jgi:two-component system cell cycle response regulator DivK